MATTTGTSTTTERVEEGTEEIDDITQVTLQKSRKRKATSHVWHFIRQYIGTGGEVVRECTRCLYKFSEHTCTGSLEAHLQR